MIHQNSTHFCIFRHHRKLDIYNILVQLMVYRLLNNYMPHCINTKSSRSVFNNTSKLSDFIFIDPWQNLKDKSIDVSGTNSFFSKFNYNHRAYRISSSVENENYRSLNSKNNINFEPVD